MRKHLLQFLYKGWSYAQSSQKSLRVWEQDCLGISFDLHLQLATSNVLTESGSESLDVVDDLLRPNRMRIAAMITTAAAVPTIASITKEEKAGTFAYVMLRV